MSVCRSSFPSAHSTTFTTQVSAPRLNTAARHALTVSLPCCCMTPGTLRAHFCMCSAGTCADGFPLGHLTSFGLKAAINAVLEKLYSLSKNNPDSMVLQQLLNSETTPWPQVKALWQKEQHKNTKKHLLKHAFLHAIMQQLDLHCWGPHGEHLAMFTQKHQVTPGLPAIAAVSWWSMHTCSQLADAVQLQGLLAAQPILATNIVNFTWAWAGCRYGLGLRNYWMQILQLMRIVHSSCKPMRIWICTPRLGSGQSAKCMVASCPDGYACMYMWKAMMMTSPLAILLAALLDCKDSVLVSCKDSAQVEY